MGVNLASQGFQVGPNTPGIVPLSPQTEGLENVVFNNYSIGTDTNELRQSNNTFQWLDNFSKVVGTHTIKAGGEFHYDQVNTHAIAQFNGSFLFFGSQTGSDFVDFLLGAPTQYNQSQLQPFYGRNKYLGLYAQDSWRLRPNLTLNYGLRWDRIEPWYEKYNQVATSEPGKQSVVFPTAPAGILFPTDPGVPRTLAPPGNKDFAPRVGLVYSPSADSDSVFGRILGGPGQTSLRAGFGMFYTAIEALTIGVLSANAPYGTTYTSPTPPLFATPFVSASTGQGQPVFPGATGSAQLLREPSRRQHRLVAVRAYQRSPGLSHHQPHSLHRGVHVFAGAPTLIEYCTQRELRGHPGTSTSRACGSESWRSRSLLAADESGEFGPRTNPLRAVSGRQYLHHSFQPDDQWNPRSARPDILAAIRTRPRSAIPTTTLSKSRLRHTGGPLQILGGYTYGKSLDQASNLGEEINPLNPALSKALSAFDVKHNFVVSYNYQLPLDHIFGFQPLDKGWAVSGITRFSTGFPVTLYNYGDNSLLGTEPNGVNNYGVDEPQYTPGALELNQILATASPISIPAFSASSRWGSPATPSAASFMARASTTTTWP